MTIVQRELGRTEWHVSEVCLGMMAFGSWIDEKESLEVPDAALGRTNFRKGRGE